jgi:hypothetical protein
MNEQSTLSNFPIAVTDLVRIIGENRGAHNEVFKAATQGYYEKLREELENKKTLAKKYSKLVSKQLKTLTEFDISRDWKDISKTASELNYLTTKKPVSYEEDYTIALRKLELMRATEIALTEKEFRQYVLNDWDWSQEFYTNNSNYVSGSLATEALLKFRK